MSAAGCGARGFSWRMSTNKPRGWRQRVGQLLHRLAMRLDGRHSLAIEICCDPPLGADRQRAVLTQALKHAHELLHDEARAAAVECVLRQTQPQLYRDKQHG
jgi:hypothetical protein